MTEEKIKEIAGKYLVNEPGDFAVPCQVGTIDDVISAIKEAISYEFEKIRYFLMDQEQPHLAVRMSNALKYLDAVPIASKKDDNPPIPEEMKEQMIRVWRLMGGEQE